MGKYATGKHALGISDRSGVAYPLHMMRKECTGMLVGFDEWEQKHPQLLTRRKVMDPQALKNPRPDIVEPLDVFVGVPLVEAPNLRALTGITQIGQVSVVIT